MKKSQHRHRFRRRRRAFWRDEIDRLIAKQRLHQMLNDHSEQLRQAVISGFPGPGTVSIEPRTVYWIDQGGVLHEIPSTPPVWPGSANTRVSS